MIFPDAPGSINGTSFRVVLEYEGPEDQNKDRIRMLTHVDGTVEFVDFGARVEQNAKIVIQQSEKQDFLDLVEYLNSNQGSKIRITQENDGEKFFTEDWAPTTYYAYVLEVEGLEETDFSTTRERFQVGIRIALAGENSGDEINPADASLIDALIQIDTVQADFNQSSEPTATAVGQRWFDTDDNKLYEWDGASWNLLYTVAADDATYGFVDGIFYLSAFSEISKDAANGIPEKHVAGLITLGSIKFPKRSIRIRNGPDIEKREGFSFSIENSTRFHNYINQNKISLYGAKVKLSLFNNADGTKYVNQKAQGIINSMTFGYSDFQKSAEPTLLHFKTKFPSTVIDETTYPDIIEEQLGKPPFISYGEIEKAALQNVSKISSIISIQKYFPDDTVAADEPVIQAQIDWNVGANTKILIRKSPSTKLRYTFTSTQISDINSGNHAIKVKRDTKSGSSNPGRARTILTIEDEPSGYANFYVLTLKAGLPTSPDEDAGADDPPRTSDTLTLSIQKSTYIFQSGESASGGFGVFDEDGEFQEGLAIFGISENGRELEALPVSGLEQSANKNQIFLDPATVSGDSQIKTFISKRDRHVIDFRMRLLDETPIDIIPPVTDPGAGFDTIHRRASRKDGWYPDSPGAGVFGAGFSARFPGGINTAHVLNLDYFAATSGSREAYCRFVPHYNVDDNEGHMVLLVAYAVGHDRPGESEILAATDVRLAMDFRIRSAYKFIDIDSFHPRVVPLGFKFMIRFRKKDGTYITDPSWEIEVDEKNLGMDTVDTADAWKRTWNIRIVNTPDPANPNNFLDPGPSLEDNFDHHIQWKFLDDLDRDAEPTANLVKNDYAWLDDSGRIDQWNGSSWDEDVITPAIGQIFFLYRNTWPANNPGIAYKVVSGSPVTLSIAAAGSDYEIIPKVQGADLFDISSMFGASPDWPDVVSLEILIENKNTFATQFDDKDSVNLRDWWIELYQNTASGSPSLHIVKEIEIENRPLFADLRGKTLAGGFPSTPSDIVTDIMDAIYPSKWLTSSITDLMALNSRLGWKWKKQFTSSNPERSESVLKELLWNLWAVAVINESDQIEFKSLNPKDHSPGSPIKTFDDSHIIAGSWSNPKFRKSSEIFQEFVLSYNFFPPSEFSNAIKSHLSEAIVDQANGSTQIKTILKFSEILYNVTNKFLKTFDYHYASLPIAEWIAEFFALNSWELKFRVSISEIASGNSLSLMQYIAVKSYFHTNDEIVEGFIVSLFPDLYDGEVEIGLYIPKPPGIFGALCDPFNDALLVGRDISGWTSANGKINDAGLTGRAPVAVKKDAGTSPRTITC